MCVLTSLTSCVFTERKVIQDNIPLLLFSASTRTNTHIRTSILVRTLMDITHSVACNHDVNPNLLLTLILKPSLVTMTAQYLQTFQICPHSSGLKLKLVLTKREEQHTHTLKAALCGGFLWDIYKFVR